MTTEPEAERPAFLVAAAGFLAYSLALLAAASSLPHAGRWIISVGALLLLAHAAGLWMRRRIAWSFAIAFYALTGIAYAILAVVILYQGYRAFADQTLGEGFGALGAGLAVGMVMAAAPLIFLLGVVSGLVAQALLRGRDALEGAEAPSMAILGTLASFALLAWNGFEYFPRDLPARNACAGGSRSACQELSYSNRPFSTGERREFMLRGCRLGSDMTCISLLLGEAPRRGNEAGPSAGEMPAVTQAETDAATAACRGPRLHVCKALAERLLATGDVETARSHLSFACSQSARFCADAAELLRKRGQPALSGTFLVAGCNGGHSESCQRLSQAGVPKEDRTRLERRACLVGSDEACDGMLARDFHDGCDHLCSQDEPRAAYVCVMCARQAALRGEAARAKAWMALSCAHGQKAACREAAGPAGSERPPSPAQLAPPGLPVSQSARARLEALLPAGCRLLDMRDDSGTATITGVADTTGRVSEALRALDALGARPELLDLQAEDGRFRFRVSLATSALEAP